MVFFMLQLFPFIQDKNSSRRVGDPVHFGRNLLELVHGLDAAAFQVLSRSFHIGSFQIQPDFGMGVIVHAVQPEDVVAEFDLMGSGDGGDVNGMFGDFHFEYVPIKSDRFFVFALGDFYGNIDPAAEIYIDG
jgi:hypothetical protein